MLKQKSGRQLYAEQIKKQYEGRGLNTEVPDHIANTCGAIAEWCLSGDSLENWKRDAMTHSNTLRVEFGLDKDGLFDINGNLVKIEVL